MTVVHINTHESTGGAARAANRLHKGLQRLGSRSSMFVAHGDTGDKATIALQVPQHHRLSWMRRRVRAFSMNRDLSRYATSRPSGYDMFSDDRSPYGREVVNQLPPCDVINLHWVAGLLDYGPFFASVPAARPVVWTLHDMNPFTGGCHYNGTCDRYTMSVAPVRSWDRQTHPIWRTASGSGRDTHLPKRHEPVCTWSRQVNGSPRKHIGVVSVLTFQFR